MDYTLRKPYLVQRATIRRPLNEYRGTMLSDAVRIDYMGAAEYEFGALPKSLAQFQHGVLHWTVHDLRDSRNRPLRVVTTTDMDSAAFNTYSGYLRLMHDSADRTIRLKERSQFPAADRGDIDLWWDIENHVWWSFDKEFMNNRLAEHIAASNQYMQKTNT